MSKETKTETKDAAKEELVARAKKNLPEGFELEMARVLLMPFHVGKPYAPGTLVLFDHSGLPEYTGSDDILVLEPGIGEQLDRQGVTGPLT